MRDKEHKTEGREEVLILGGERGSIDIGRGERKVGRVLILGGGRGKWGEY